MKELTQEFKDTKVEIVSEKEQKKEVKLIGRQRRIPGLTLWEFNRVTQELLPAQYKKEDVVISKLSTSKEDLVKRNNVIVKENCFYFQALNEKNARRKLKLKK